MTPTRLMTNKAISANNTLRRAWKKTAVLIVLVLTGVGLISLMPLGAKPRRETREIHLVARDMSFYLDGAASPNPTITVRRGEEVRLMLRNDEPGVTHDFVVTSLKVSMEPLRGSGTRTIVFRAPAETGRHQYVCTPHAAMMKGQMVVIE